MLRNNGVCFRCIVSCDHLAKDCKAKVVCTKCGSDKHLATLHVDGEQRHGGEQTANKDKSGDGTNPQQNQQVGDITARCTEVCGNSSVGNHARRSAWPTFTLAEIQKPK